MTEPHGSRVADSGASLIFVLIFLMLVSVMALSTLTYTQVSFEVGDGYRMNREKNYAADAALELAIHQVTREPTGKLGGPLGPTCQFAVKGLNGADVTVRCEPKDGAGGPDPSKKAYALLSLSQTEPLSLTGNKPLSVAGDVHTNHSITTGQTFNVLDMLPSGRMTSRGANASDECSSVTKVLALSRNCASGLVADPGRQSRATTGLPLNPSPTCQKAGSGPWVARFPSGRYTASPSSAAVLLAAANNNCDKAEVLYFPDSVYHFTDGVSLTTAHPKPGSPAMDLVAGVGSWFAAKTQVPSVEGGCDASGSGTQLVFDATSSLTLSNDDVDVHLCAGPGGVGNPATAVYGGSILKENKPNLFVSGGIYTPGGQVQLALQSPTDKFLIVRGGIIADRIRLHWLPSNVQSVAAFSAPAECTTCVTDRHVVFTATVSTDPTSTADDVAWTRAVVKFDDAGGTDPAHPYDLESWTVLP